MADVRLRAVAGERPPCAICLTDDDRALGKMGLHLPGHASPATTCEAIGAGLPRTLAVFALPVPRS